MSKLRASLPVTLRKCVWNTKYRLLGYPRWEAPNDVVQLLSTSPFEGQTVLDLGCGRGSLLRALREKGWAGSYCGVDISSQAINDARRLGDQRSSWAVSDFESFRSPFHWDVIAMVESLYYVKLDEVEGFICGLASMLAPRGALLIRLHDPDKYRAYIETMQRLFPHVERVGNNLYSIGASPGLFDLGQQ